LILPEALIPIVETSKTMIVEMRFWEIMSEANKQ